MVTVTSVLNFVRLMRLKVEIISTMSLATYGSMYQSVKNIIMNLKDYINYKFVVCVFMLVRIAKSNSIVVYISGYVLAFFMPFPRSDRHLSIIAMPSSISCSSTCVKLRRIWLILEP